MYTVEYYHYDRNTYKDSFETESEAVEFMNKVYNANCVVTNTNF